MKKKYRDITVDDEQFAWAIQGVSNIVKVWQDGKELCHLEFDKDLVSVTPSMVADRIRDYVNHDQ